MLEPAELLSWSSRFQTLLESKSATLIDLQLAGGDDYTIALAKHQINEAVEIVKNASFGIQHPDTKGQDYAIENIIVDSTLIGNVIRQVFLAFMSKACARLIVKPETPAAALASSIADLMHQSGLTELEVACQPYAPEIVSKIPVSSCKLSTVAVVFKQTDTFAAAQGVLESYHRDRCRNLLILVEESAYDRFIRDWQRYYSHVVQIGPQRDHRTLMVPSFNNSVRIDLAAIDIKASHKMTGHAINVLKFRTFSELVSLFNHLRKVPVMSVWNDDVLLSREFCLRMNQCNEFWLNHVPKSLAGRRFREDLLNYYSETVTEDMTYVYNLYYDQFTEEAEQLRKLQAAFLRKAPHLRTMLVAQAYSSVLSKSKVLQNGASVRESLAQLTRFQQMSIHRVESLESGDSRIESILKPVGLALLVVRSETSIKSKAVLLDFIFKNLIIGNAVLLVCPVNILGSKFSIDNDHIIPFKMVHESLPDVSKLSLTNSTVSNKRQCPKNTYAMEILPDMTSDTLEVITLALGGRSKCIWYPDSDQANYWSNE